MGLMSTDASRFYSDVVCDRGQSVSESGRSFSAEEKSNSYISSLPPSFFFCARCGCGGNRNRSG